MQPSPGPTYPISLTPSFPFDLTWAWEAFFAVLLLIPIVLFGRALYRRLRHGYGSHPAVLGAGLLATAGVIAWLVIDSTNRLLPPFRPLTGVGALVLLVFAGWLVLSAD